MTAIVPREIARPQSLGIQRLKPRQRPPFGTQQPSIQRVLPWWKRCVCWAWTFVPGVGDARAGIGIALGFVRNTLWMACVWETSQVSTQDEVGSSRLWHRDVDAISARWSPMRASLVGI